ncbi:MAG: DUF4249 domain-containing protein [Flavobacteriales bacterium]|nr:DUF4249 domain-containing protein [Flavobacteriales bacterium]
MKQIFHLFPICVMFLLLSSSGCTKLELADAKTADKAVVNAFIYPGNEFAVKLSRLIPFVEETEDTIYTLDSVDVFLFINGVTHQLTAVADSSGQYELSDTGIAVAEGDELKLLFTYNGLEITASSTVPAKPANAYLSTTSYTVATGFGAIDTDPLSVYWDNPVGSYYLVISEYMGTSYEMLNEFPEEVEFTDEELEAMRKTSSQPLATSSYDIRRFTFSGSHRIIIYHLSEEYVKLIESGGSSSITITEPYTNVNNGLGIFTAINTDTLWLQVHS